MGSSPFERLLRGKTLKQSDGPLVDGRVDLRKSVAPTGALSESPHGPTFARVATKEFKKVEWRQLDLSRSRLSSFRFHRSRIEDCVLDQADCTDWRLWGTQVENTSFCGANLTGAVLGAVDEGRRNRYRRVDFSGADLRGSVHVSSDFEHCDFSGARLDNVDFQGSVFSNCRFAGELSDVLFYRHAFRGETHPPNEMREVDFSGARLHYVGFRGLDLTTVRWPEGRDHLLIRDYARTLHRMIEALRPRVDDAARGLLGLLLDYRKWAGGNQQVGVIKKTDVAELGDPGLIQVLEQLANEAQR